MKGILNKRFRVLALAVFIGILGVAVNAPVQAADDGKRSKEAIRRVQQANQKLAAEKAQLEQEKTGLQADVEKLKAAEATISSQLDQGRKEKRGLVARLAALEAQHSELKNKNDSTEEALRQAELDKKRLESMLEEQRQTIGRQVKSVQTCEEKNLKLYQIGVEALDQYRNKSCTTTLLEKEPFTGLRKIESEALLQEYQERLDSSRLASGKVSP